MEIFQLFDTSRFMARAYCGNWTPSLIYFHNVSDFFIWTAYVTIPLVLLSFAYRRRDELPFRELFWLFGLFIVACGTTHLMDIILFYKPLYTLSGWIKLITAGASWGTVVALFHVAPRALQMRSPEKLEQEVRERTAQLEELNAQLQEANRAKDELLRREQAARHEAEEANRAKDNFLATVSHELRTPLTSMMGWAALMRGGATDEKSLQQAMSAIERNAKAQAQIIDDLLDVSRIITGKMKLDARPISVAPIVEAALDAVRPAAHAKEITLDVDLAATESIKIRGDAARLQQIVWNLVSNAVKFTPKGGHVWVKLEREASQALIIVRDDGQGIETQFLSHVFERFQQADNSSTRSFGGLGLGLSIVRHLVEMHGGTIEAQSAGQGQGAMFIVRLPLLAVNHSSEAEMAALDGAQSVQHSVPASILRDLRLLIVEDDADARQMITTVLEHYGAQVQSAPNAALAFDMLRDGGREAKPDVMIFDIGLPGEDGYSLMERVRTLSPEEGGLVPAAALTAFAGSHDRRRALSAGFQVHLSKPVEPSELVVTVAGLAGRSINRMAPERE